MILADKLYVSENIGNIKKIIKNITLKRPMIRTYILVYLFSENRLELFHSLFFFARRIQEKRGIIIGLSKGRRAGFFVIKNIIETALINEDINDLSLWFKKTYEDNKGGYTP